MNVGMGRAASAVFKGVARTSDMSICGFQRSNTVITIIDKPAISRRKPDVVDMGGATNVKTQKSQTK